MTELATGSSTTVVDPKVALVAQIVALNLPQDKLLSTLLDDKPGTSQRMSFTITDFSTCLVIVPKMHYFFFFCHHNIL